MQDPWGTLPRKDISVAEKVSVIKFISEMNVCIVHGGHGKERIYLLQKKYYIYISESHYPSEKLARDISVGVKCLHYPKGAQERQEHKICQIYFRMKFCIIQVETGGYRANNCHFLLQKTSNM